ncbi:MAG TPA: hypothetical protein VLI05_01335 [Candidatus Saccharimonadia bacterium]|nr:hypothetical protein [Candidatus Saccharimonadia bacterium]
MSKIYTFKVTDSSRASLEYGTLSLTVKNGVKRWEFKAASETASKEWGMTSLFPIDDTSNRLSDHIESILYQRAPLRWRISKNKKDGSFDEILELIKESHMVVASDTYQIVPA